MKPPSSQIEEINFLNLIRNSIKANTEILDQLKFLKEIISKLNVAIYIHDLKKLRHTWTNNNYSKIIGYTDFEISQMGPEWAEKNYHPNDRLIMKERLNFYKKNKGDTFSGIYRIKHKKGHWVWVYSSSIVFKRDEKGLPEQLLGMCIDFSDNFKTMKQFKELYKENQQLKNDLLIARLTNREKEVISFIAEGKTSQQIAEILNISLHTANNHRKNMLRKLKLHNIAELTRFAAETGLA
ncbi:MAG: LuxR C-terminal-related transcriptional regulator [Bacteroidales bacterium]